MYASRDTRNDSFKLECVRVLLEHNADTTIKNKAGETALDLARYSLANLCVDLFHVSDSREYVEVFTTDTLSIKMKLIR